MHHEFTEVREVRVSYGPPVAERLAFTRPQQIADFVRPLLPDNSREHFFALYLDGSHRVNCYSLISTGTANHCHIHPREIFQRAVVSGACSVVLAHNHPSGSVEPSPEDWATTERMKTAGKLLGIKVLDHIVVTDETYTSMAACGRWVHE